MHFGSLLFSAILHIALALTILLWPQRTPTIMLNKPIMQISLNMGAPGGNRLPSPVLGPQGAKTAPKPTPHPARAEKAPGEAIALENKMHQAEVRKQAEVRPKPVEPKPNPEVGHPKPSESPKPEKTAPTADKKPAVSPKQTKAERKDNDRKSRASGSGKDEVSAALAEAARSSGRGGSRGSKGSSVADALAEFERSSRGSGHNGGGGGDGDGEGGGGINDVYAGLVIMAVRPNWNSVPIASRRAFVTKVRITLDPSGKVTDCRIEQGSGRPEYDASCVNAIVRTKVLPPPPTPSLRELVIAFNSLELSGR
ncbi:MAG: cell envelope integrity protein TolA [Desulfovibrionaceae bacterium]|nr:cell envelope integrity protein TolA [Desulfovibrionaceae bacterium]